MTILNVGSINWDRIYHLPRFPLPGETLAALSSALGLGGKGLNQSVAIHRAGGRVRHFGGIGAQDQAMRAALAGLGLDLSLVQAIAGVETGTALILLDASAENAIITDAGANARLGEGAVRAAVAGLTPRDWLLVQNETNATAPAVAEARARGIPVCLSAAPFRAADVLPLLDQVTLLSVNEVEYGQLCQALGGEDRLPRGLRVLLSLGARGARLMGEGPAIEAPGFQVTPLDTTGAGDTALGAYLGRLDRGEAPQTALRYAMAAAAIQVTRPGAVPAIPTESDVLSFLKARA